MTAAERASWWLIAAMATACLLACRGLGFRIDMARAAAPAIGLAILVIYFRGRGTIAVDDVNRMKG